MKLLKKTAVLWYTDQIMSAVAHPETVPSTPQSYPRDSAGRHMTVAVPTAHADETLRKVHERLLQNGHTYETINYVYVLDSDGTLHGVLSVKEIFSHPLTKRIGDVCKRAPLVSVYPDSHQEHVAYLALRHGIKAVPVVSRHHIFLGEITSDRILKILHKEMHEDTLRRAGIRHPAASSSNVLTLSLVTSFRHRIPWLCFGLIGGILAAKVIGLFDGLLSENLVLAAFIPLIVYMSNAVGMQMETYIIRDLAIDRSIPFFRYLVRHSIVVFAMGLVLGVVLFVSYGILSQDWFMASVLALSLFGTVLSSVCTGLLIPYAFSAFTLDPADASGPIATIIQDILSILIYFSIATVLL